MANIKAAKSGNWSDTTVWTGGVLPGAADTAIANGFTVTIDQDITVTFLDNTTLSSSTAGGWFEVSSVTGTRNISITSGLGNVSGTHIGATGGLLRISATSGTVALGTTEIKGGGTSSYVALLISGSGVTVSGSGTITAGTATSAHAITISGSAIVSTGNIVGGTNSNAFAVYISGANATVRTGTVTGSTTTTAYVLGIYGTNNSVSTGVITTSVAHAIYVNAANNSVTVTGNISTTGAGNAINVSANGTTNIIDVQGSATASSTGAAFYAGINLGTYRFRGPIVNNGSRQAIWANNFIVYGSENQTSFTVYDSLGNAVELKNWHDGSPAPSNVRKGVVYGPNSQLTGTMEVPHANSVAKGVTVDTTTGNAVLTGAAVVASEIASGVSIAQRVNNTATISGTGDQLQGALS